MRIFYLALLIVSAIGIIADVILRYVEKIKSFDIDKINRNFFISTSSLVPVGKFIPENVTVLLISVMAAAVTGIIADFAEQPWYLSLPCAVAAGLSMSFTVQYILRNAVDFITQKRLPKGEKAAGLSGVCIEPLADGEVGTVRFSYKGREFTVYAGIPEGESYEISAGEPIIALYEQSGYYFVTTADKIYKGIDTNF